MTYGLRNADDRAVPPESYKALSLDLGQWLGHLQAARIAYLEALAAGNPYRDARALDLAELVERLEEAVSEMVGGDAFGEGE